MDGVVSISRELEIKEISRKNEDSLQQALCWSEPLGEQNRSTSAANKTITHHIP